MITVPGCKCKDYAEIVGPDKEPEKKDAVKIWLSTACCPNSHCHAVGQFSIHGYYTRDCMDIIDGEFVWYNLTVVRGLCKSCGTTDAFLPADIIPYRHILNTCLLIILWISLFAKDTSFETEGSLNLPEAESMSYYDDTTRISYTIRGIYILYDLLKSWMGYLCDILRRLELWEKERQPSEAEVIKILLTLDISDIQQAILEIHRIPLFFKRKRTADGFPFTGMVI